jgi:hypothetical protein
MDRNLSQGEDGLIAVGVIGELIIGQEVAGGGFFDQLAELA